MVVKPPVSQATRYEPPSIAVRWLMRLIALAGLAISGLLLSRSGATALPGCGAGSGCDTVLASQWSRIGGLPVALPALVVYIVMFVALAFIVRGRPLAVQRRRWTALIILAGAAVGAAAWFGFVQIAYLDAYCPYCLAVHGCSVALAGLTFLSAPIGRRRILPDDADDPMMIPPTTAINCIVVGLAGVVVMIGVQRYSEPDTHRTTIAGQVELPDDTEEHTHFVLPDQATVVQIGRDEFPVIGSPRARYMLVYMFDYTCPICRTLHGTLISAVARYGEDQLSVLALPTPLSTKCNEHVDHEAPRQSEACDLARLALAVWRADAAQFGRFDKWLFERDQPPTAAEAQAHARTVAGDPALDPVLQSAWPDETLKRATAIYGQAGAGGLPKLFVRDAFIEGRPKDLDALSRELERVLDLTPR